MNPTANGMADFVFGQTVRDADASTPFMEPWVITLASETRAMRFELGTGGVWDQLVSTISAELREG